MTKTAREIRVKTKDLSNENVSVQIGAMENKESPSTIYISMGFWTKPISNTLNAREVFKREMHECYRAMESNNIVEGSCFPDKKNNIFIINIPENFNYNEKRNYVNVELYLHTSNIGGKTRIPLSSKKNNPLYESALNIVEAFVSSELMTDKKGFEIRRTNKG